jgi:hypothetical protein
LRLDALLAEAVWLLVKEVVQALVKIVTEHRALVRGSLQRVGRALVCLGLILRVAGGIVACLFRPNIAYIVNHVCVRLVLVVACVRLVLVVVCVRVVLVVACVLVCVLVVVDCLRIVLVVVAGGVFVVACALVIVRVSFEGC